MVNSGTVVTATFADARRRAAGTRATPPSPACPAPPRRYQLRFADTAGSATGSLLPTGHVRDIIDGIEVTCVDNGMPVVVARAATSGITGYEPVEELAGDPGLAGRIQALRLAAGKLMGLGDVSAASVPKTTLVSAPRDGGTICTRTFIPVTPHTSIGVLGGGDRRDRAAACRAASVPSSRSSPPLGMPSTSSTRRGHLEVEVELDHSADPPRVLGAGVIRTARKLFDGTVFPASRTDPADRTAAMTRLLHEVAHLGHAELLTPEPEKSLWFFTEVLGLTENGTSGDSVYLRTWDDYEHHSLKLTASATSGIGRTGLRAASEEALKRRVAEIEQTWPGRRLAGRRPRHRPHLPVPRSRTVTSSSCTGRPSGTGRRVQLKPALKNQAQAYPGRGCSVRRLDHVNFLAARTEPNGRFVCSALGGRVTEQIMLDDGTISAQWTHFAQKSYDLVYTNDWTGRHGRLHHIAFATDTREDVLRAADICLDRRGVHRDRAAQARHPADVLPLRLRARREPDRAVQPVRKADLRAGLGARSPGPRPSGRRGRPGD